MNCYKICHGEKKIPSAPQKGFLSVRYSLPTSMLRGIFDMALIITVTTEDALFQESPCPRSRPFLSPENRQTSGLQAFCRHILSALP